MKNRASWLLVAAMFFRCHRSRIRRRRTLQDRLDHQPQRPIVRHRRHRQSRDPGRRRARQRQEPGRPQDRARSPVTTRPTRRPSAQVCARFVLEDKVQAIVGAQPTPSRLACNQAAVKAGLPYIAASGSAGDICLPNMFYVGQVPNQFVLAARRLSAEAELEAHLSVRRGLFGAARGASLGEEGDRGTWRHGGRTQLQSAGHFATSPPISARSPPPSPTRCCKA